MSLLDMSPLDWVNRVTDYSQRSLQNTMGTIKSVHQTHVEMPINVAQELGAPADKCAAAKATHRQVLDHLHNGFLEACEEVHEYVAKQATLVNELAAGKPVDGSDVPAEQAELPQPPRLRKLG